MIASVTVRLAADDGIPLVIAEEHEMVVQVPDFEANVLKGAAKLDDLIDSCRKKAQQQVRAYREGDASG